MTNLLWIGRVEIESGNYAYRFGCNVKSSETECCSFLRSCLPNSASELIEAKKDQYDKQDQFKVFCHLN